MKNKLILMLFAGTLALGGCSEDFLETEPTQFASADQISEASELNPSLQNANVAGLYTTMIVAESGGTTGHDDFGQKGYDIFSDMLSGDMVLAGYTYGWYQDIVEYQTTIDFTDQNNYQVWRYYYRLIFGANNIITGLGGDDAVLETDEAKHIMGQAKAMRAYSYFYLAQYYAKGYNPSEPILPIYTDVEGIAKGLSPASEVYDLIVSDLTASIDLLSTFTRTAKNAVNQDVAKGLLAYTYAAMGNYAEAKTLTGELINLGSYQIVPSAEVAYMGDPTVGGFKDLNTSGWMWGSDITLDNGLDLVSWWGQIDLFTYSYAWAGDPKTIHAGLYAQIPEDDVRKGQFVNAYGNGVLYPINKFYPAKRDVAGQRNIETDYVYMRIAEMYLLHAEAAAMTSDEAAAKGALKTLLSERLDDPSYVDALSGDALLDEIYLQTRIELWGEGKSYLAMKRLKATITTGSNHLSLPGVSFPYDATELTFEIPLSEIQNNPNIN